MNWSVFLVLFTVFYSCNNQSVSENEVVLEDTSIVAELPLIPIPYDFDGLNLYLNGDYRDGNSNIEWTWNHMWSDNDVQDDSGIEYYENRNQAAFSFYGRQMTPTLSITTDEGRIIEFSAGTILCLNKGESELKDELLDSLGAYDLLQQAEIKKRVSDSLCYSDATAEFEAFIHMTLPDYKRLQGSINYTIKSLR